MLEKYRDSQSVFYNYFMHSFNSNRISHAYLIETNNVSYNFSLAMDLAKFLLCDGVYNAKICSLIDNNNYPDLKILLRVLFLRSLLIIIGKFILLVMLLI